METDKIFKQKIEQTNDFQFNADVVNVFDDMVVRSVPFYLEMQRMMAELAQKHSQPSTSLYDLGCSTGTTFMALSSKVDKSVKFVGVDEAPEMLKSCKKNLKAHKIENELELKSFDLNKGVEIKNASVVVLCLTLQFVRPLNRAKLIKSIYEQMNSGACLLLVEKVIGEDSNFNREFIEHYYDFKRRNKYNDMEIAQKREALENILIPYKLSENFEMLFDAGFSECETFFKWYNFAGMVAIK